MKVRYKTRPWTLGALSPEIQSVAAPRRKYQRLSPGVWAQADFPDFTGVLTVRTAGLGPWEAVLCPSAAAPIRV